ncbi:hypothetical protein RD792_016996 [Penstemon davidsonii]|uniref:glutathione transferase n=1 Tax=Penstemon davidsonii TaxID=160366 RepID=A0ABR0CLM0_9LAMI|nr:hypothetical protein RD792_016996 [Penstemon davidsonii]
MQNQGLLIDIAYTYADKETQLTHSDPNKMAVVSEWMEVEAQKLDPLAMTLTWEFVINPGLGIATDNTVVEEYEAMLAKVLDLYEARLALSKYLGEDNFTLADLHPLPTIYYLMGTEVKTVFT